MFVLLSVRLISMDRVNLVQWNCFGFHSFKNSLIGTIYAQLLPILTNKDKTEVFSVKLHLEHRVTVYVQTRLKSKVFRLERL